MRALRAPIFYVLLTVALAAGGGWTVVVLSNGERAGDHAAQGLLATGAALAALGAGRGLARRGPREARDLKFGLAAYVILGVFLLSAAETAAAVRGVPWPAMGLHGVEPEAGRKAWHRSALWRKDGTLNSWGQRDLERPPAPPAGRVRVALVGDSFLEEGGTAPLSVRTEQLSGNPYEVLNLGVSATGPGEYYYRIKNIALPLGAERVIYFFYTGNDFYEVQDLRSWWGMAAVYPRDSLLSKLGLLRLNHLLSNRHRPLLRAWGRAGELNRMEDARRALVLGLSDEALRRFLLNFVEPDNRPRLYTALSRPSAQAFFQMLRRPDQGLFRSYILERALEVASGQRLADPIDETPAYEWVLRAYQTCRKARRQFVLVIVPEAFAVDPRMRAQWAALADLEESFRPNREAAARLAERAKADGIPVLDLHPIFDGKEGAYLNLDGHWSAAGGELAARTLAAYLRRSARDS